MTRGRFAILGSTDRWQPALASLSSIDTSHRLRGLGGGARGRRSELARAPGDRVRRSGRPRAGCAGEPDSRLVCRRCPTTDSCSTRPSIRWWRCRRARSVAGSAIASPGEQESLIAAVRAVAKARAAAAASHSVDLRSTPRSGNACARSRVEWRASCSPRRADVPRSAHEYNSSTPSPSTILWRTRTWTGATITVRQFRR